MYLFCFVSNCFTDMHMHHVLAWFSWGLEEGVGSHGTELQMVVICMQDSNHSLLQD